MNHKLSKLNKIIIIYIIATIALLSNVNATTSQTDNENTNNDLASLSITDYQISPEFNKNTRNYYVAIPTTISSVEVNAQAESAKATVKITGNTQLTKTENTIQIVVTSAKGRKKTYKIIVTKQKENTLKLQSLEIKGATFSPAFDSSKYYYTAEMKINDDSKDITVEAVANNANAKIEVIGNKGIKAGENLVSVIVSDSRETTVYEILINATVEKTIISNVENNDKIQQVKNGVLEFFKDENKVIALLVAVAVILIIIIICIIKKISGKNRADKNREKLRKRAK
ncbi:cell wall binding repeat protein [Clostridium sp. CAG:793]|nr:cell wall binding repeat protein [Clostridium sp. CAG:793]